MPDAVIETRSFALATRQSTFTSFDGRVSAVAYHQRPDRYRHLEAEHGARPRIPRGAGLSYAAASFGAGVLVQDMTAFSRFLAYDAACRSLTVEAGMRIGDLLSWAIARDLFLPVVPGHPDITVGGCIAADVHGKNPRIDGTFRDWIRALTLYHPEHGFVRVTRAANPELFDVTCGGFGLSGVIVDATLELVRLPARGMRLHSRRVDTLHDGARFVSASEDPLAYTWHAGGSSGTRFGRGLAFSGRWSADDDAPPPARPLRWGAATRRTRRTVSLWNPLSLAAANQVFQWVHGARNDRTRAVLDTCFPLARRDAYFRFFGRNGFGELQLLIPVAECDRFFERFRNAVTEHRPAIAFMSLKGFNGRANALSVSGEGVLFAVDYVATPDVGAFERAVDALLLDTGAQPNIAKDSRIGRDVVLRSLPNFSAFAEALHRADRGRTFQSELSRRLGL